MQIPPDAGATAAWITLTRLEAFSVLATIISLGFNFWQWQNERQRHIPLLNMLIGLFNDLKDRQQRAYQKALLLDLPPAQAMTAEALRFSYWDFSQEMIQANEQLREHVASAITTLNPNASTQTIYKAAEFGLTEQERQFRESGSNQYMKAFAEQQRLREEA